MSHSQSFFNTTIDILSASSGAVVGWFLYRVVVTSFQREWNRGGAESEDRSGLEERIRILEKENETLYERTAALALENRLLCDRILQVAFVDEDDDVSHVPGDVDAEDDDDWSWCWWEQEDNHLVYKTPEKTGMRHSEEVHTPPQDNDTRVHHG